LLKRRDVASPTAATDVASPTAASPTSRFSDYGYGRRFDILAY